MQSTWQPDLLPPVADLETRAVLKMLPAARAALAELKGIVATIPNESILLDTLPLQEAKDSSAVENIITTHDELFQAEVQVAESHASKEVQRYAAALRLGVGLVHQYGMAVLHLQFESIHPFYDGNGRTGRILNILYLVLKGLLDMPVLYLSRFIIRNKAEYYQHLQAVRDTGNWEPWLLYLITGVEQTARESIILITEMRQLMQQTKQQLRSYKFYSQDLLNNLFRRPYTRIEFLQAELKVSRPTAASYLNQLAADGVLVKHRLVTANYYVNQPLFELLARLG